MLLFAISKVRNPDLSDAEIFKELGSSKNLHKEWVKRYGKAYTDWLEEYMEGQTYRKSDLLEAVGMAQALQAGNYQYWRDMAKTHGVIRDEPKTSTTININTDFNQILSEGKSFEESRRELLARLRGVEYKGRPRVVDAVGVTVSGGDGSEGDRASGVQEKPVAVDNSLGKDGGCSEPREPVPAIPVGQAPADPHPLLAKRKKPAHTKK